MTNPSFRGDRAVAIVDPMSTGAYLPGEFRSQGWAPVAVLSSSRLPDVLTRTFRPDDFVAIVDEDGDVDATVKQLRGHPVQAVIAGAEPGVELADALAERLGLPGNDGGNSRCRRDKVEMAETVLAHGLRAPRTAAFDNAADIIAWADALGIWPLVVKPRRSAGSDGVFFCADPDSVQAAAHSLIGRTSRLGEVNDSVCVQELVSGQQYFVNTVSREGRHYVGEIWTDVRRPVPGHSLAYDHCDLLPVDGEQQRELVARVREVLDALGVRWGPAHTEFVWTDSGPVLLEVGARMEGTIKPECVQAALGYSHVTRTVDLITDPEGFDRACAEPYRLRRFLRQVCLIAPYDGVIADASLLSTTHVPSLAGVVGQVHTGRRVAKTIDMFTLPATVYLLARTHDELVRDTERVRALEANGLYAPTAQ